MLSTLGLWDLLSVGGVVVLAQYLATRWLKVRLEASVKAEYDKRLEDYRYELRIREQAAKAAEYLSLAWRLDAEDEEDLYRRVNQIGWELALWLPDNVYRQLTQAIANPSQNNNLLTTIVEIRKILLLDDAGSLNADDIAFHAPNIGDATTLHQATASSA